MEFVLSGKRCTLDTGTVRTAVRSHAPDEVCEHWVDVYGVRWPLKQVFAPATGTDRSGFTSHTALRQLQRLATAAPGTSPVVGGPARHTRQDGDVTCSPTSVAAAASSAS